MSNGFPEWWKHGQKVRTRKDGILTLNIAPDAEYWLTNDEGKEVYVFSADILGPVKNDAEVCRPMSNIDKQALRVPEREKHDWSQAVMRDCDFCQQWALTVKHDDGGCICASCCDSEYTTALSSALVVAIESTQAAEKRIAELTGENEYIRKRFKEADLLFGKNLLVMQAAIIEWQGTGDAKKGLAWIYNTLWGPGELPDEAEKDAQAYFDRKYAPLDEELMALHRWFWEQSEAERAAAAGKGE